MSAASKNVAENVPRLILFAMLASVSFIPCFFSRSASSRYPTSARANSTLRNRLARSSQEGGFPAIGILSRLNNAYHIRYLPLDKSIVHDILLAYMGGRSQKARQQPARGEGAITTAAPMA